MKPDRQGENGERANRTTGHDDIFKDICGKCGAKRIDNQLGLEKTPEFYVENTVKWAREVWRVLRKDGTFWLNLGDSYATSGSGSGQNNSEKSSGEACDGFRDAKYLNQRNPRTAVSGLKPKDLCGIPWKVVFALQADGWWLRSAMPWIKRSSMPESCTDRPASALEYMFLLTKSGTSQYWTHRDFSGVREIPKPDWRWQHQAEELELDEPPDGWIDSLILCSICDGTGYENRFVDTDLFGETQVTWGSACENCKDTEYIIGDLRFIKEWKRINLWQGHDYYFDMTAIRKRKVDMDVINPYIKPYENIYEKTESGQTEGLSEVQCEREGKSKNKRIQTVGSGKDFVQQMAAVGKGDGLHGQVQEDGKKKSSSDEIHQDGEILQNTKEISDISEGERIAIKGSTQKTNESGELHKHIDGGGVGTNKKTTESSVCDLQGKEKTDQRSRSVDQQGRPSREGKHPSSLPSMQYQKGQQRDFIDRGDDERGRKIRCGDADESGRNFRNTDLFYQSLEEPHGAIFCGDEMVGLDVNPQAYKDAHFATFAEKLVEPLIKAGTSEKGACPECGAPWERVVEKKKPPKNVYTDKIRPDDVSGVLGGTAGMGRKLQDFYEEHPSKTIGWQPTCSHKAEPVPCVVLDIFGGSGTTKNVADRLGRRGVICELKMEYIDMAKKRCYQEPNLF